MAQFRLIVCFDIEAENLRDAYTKLSSNMDKLGEDTEWESSDEWYGPDGEGPGDAEELQLARMAHFAERIEPCETTLLKSEQTSE